MRKSAVNNIFKNKMNNNPSYITKIDKGVEDSYIVKTKRNKYFIKFLDSGYFKPEGFVAGGKLLDIIEDKSEIPVPSLYYISDKKSDNYPYYITEYIDGYNTTQYKSNKFSDRYYKQFQKNLGRYIAQFNNINVGCDEYGWAGWFEDGIRPFGGHSNFQKFIIQRLEDSLSSIEDENPMRCIKNHLEDILPLVKELDINFSGICMVNYDIKFQNIILCSNDEKPIKSIIDWDNPIIGVPEYNIAKIERHFIKDYRVNMNDIDKYFDLFINTYCKNSKYDINKNITETLRFDLCRLADYTDVSKHFVDYYGDLDEKEINNAVNYYKQKICRIINRIEEYV